MSTRKKQIALALGSGGARGLAHIGVIKALEENQIPVDIVAGTSIGALIGGLYAAGVSVKAMEKIIHDVDKIMVAKILMPKFFAAGFIDNKKVIDFIKELVDDVKIENLKKPFAAIATDFITGEEVILDKGSLVDAIMASSAIPTIFQPVFLKNRYFIDGGLSNPLPISVAKDMGAQKILAVNVSPNPKRITKINKRKKTEEIKLLIKKLSSLFTNLLNENKQWLPHSDSDNQNEENEIVRVYSPSIRNVFLQSISISTNNLIKQRLRHAKPDILLSPNIEDFDMLEFYKGEEILQCGYEEVQKSLPEIQACLSKT